MQEDVIIFSPSVLHPSKYIFFLTSECKLVVFPNYKTYNETHNPTELLMTCSKSEQNRMLQ
jgi:hypothetical protein